MSLSVNSHEEKWIARFSLVWTAFTAMNYTQHMRWHGEWILRPEGDRQYCSSLMGLCWDSPPVCYRAFSRSLFTYEWYLWPFWQTLIDRMDVQAFLPIIVCYLLPELNLDGNLEGHVMCKQTLTKGKKLESEWTVITIFLTLTP